MTLTRMFGPRGGMDVALATPSQIPATVSDPAMFGVRSKPEPHFITVMTDDQLADLTESVIELDALLDYQDGAIVSRTLVDRDAATLTIFACDAGQTISEHTAPHEALLQLLDGRARVTIDGTDYELSAGESIVMPADTPHAVEAIDRFKMLLTMVR